MFDKSTLMRRLGCVLSYLNSRVALIGQVGFFIFKERRRQVKILWVLLIAILISLVGYPAYSQEPLVLYDNFRGKSIDPDKWLDIPVTPGIIDVKRFVKWNRLHLMQRSYGGPQSSGQISTRIRLQFKNPLVTAIQAKFKVKHVEVVGCPSTQLDIPDRASRLRAGRLSGSFFNTGSVDPPPDAINDVFAAIEIVRESVLPDPDGMLMIRGRVIRCTDPFCSGGDELPGSPVDLGTIMVGQWTKLLIQWDREYTDDDDATGAFIFQRDNDPEIILPYYFENEIDALDPSKRIGVDARVTNCAGEPRPVGYADVVIKNVFVNATALEE